MSRPIVADSGKLRENRSGDRSLFGSGVDNGVDSVQVGGSLTATTLKQSGTPIADLFSPKIIGRSNLPGNLRVPHFVLPAESGDYVDQSLTGASMTSVILAANNIEAFPFIPDRDMTIDQLGVAISTSQYGSSITVGIYASAANGTPSDLLVSGAAGSDFSVYSGITTSLTLTAGTLYWLAIAVSTSNVTVRAINAGGCLSVGQYSAGHITISFTRLRQAFTYTSTLPSSWGSYAASQRQPGHVPSFRMRIV